LTLSLLLRHLKGAVKLEFGGILFGARATFFARALLVATSFESEDESDTMKGLVVSCSLLSSFTFFVIVVVPRQEEKVERRTKRNKVIIAKKRTNEIQIWISFAVAPNKSGKVRNPKRITSRLTDSRGGTFSITTDVTIRATSKKTTRCEKQEIPYYYAKVRRSVFWRIRRMQRLTGDPKALDVAIY
jgi:hypothetical protein